MKHETVDLLSFIGVGWVVGGWCSGAQVKLTHPALNKQQHGVCIRELGVK